MKNLIITAIIATLMLAAPVMAASSLTTSWNMGSGTINIDTQTEVFANHYAESSVDVYGQGAGSFKTETTDATNPYYGQFHNTLETLDASGFNQVAGVTVQSRYDDDVYGLNPNPGYVLDTKMGGNYDLYLRTRAYDWYTEAAFDSQMNILNGGGYAEITMNQAGTNSNTMYGGLLTVSTPGTLNMFKPSAYSQALHYTVFGDVSATGAGDFVLAGTTAGTNRKLDFRVKGNLDSTSFDAQGNDVTGGSVFGNFANSLDIDKNWNAQFDTAQENTYWPVSWTGLHSVGYEFAFNGNLV